MKLKILYLKIIKLIKNIMNFFNVLFVCLLGPGKPGSYLILKKKIKLFMNQMHQQRF